MTKYLVTGGAGFIGSNYIHFLLDHDPEAQIVNLDKLTYCGNLENLRDVEKIPRYQFVRGDIADRRLVEEILAEGVDVLVNFAAETHVDRAVLGPEDFIRTDVLGTFTLLDVARERGVGRYVQISTDEVYGSIAKGAFTEDSPLNPSSPYSAGKAGGDLIARSYFVTYGMDVCITRCSNNFGPFQYPEKVIPLFVTNALEDRSLPLYGDGLNERDWLYVLDHCEAIQVVVEKGEKGQIYNIGTGHTIPNIQLTETILEVLDKPHTLIQRVEDRPGHDRRYCVDASKIRRLGWRARHDFDSAIRETVEWYIQHPEWWKRLKSGEYLAYYKAQYGQRKPIEDS